MIPVEITKDLRNGLSLEETLLRHNTNLKELFKPNQLKTNTKFRKFDDWTNIQPTSCNTFRVNRTHKKRKIEYGTYRTHDDAMLVRNELIKCGWDKNELPRIIKENRIITNKRGGYRR